VFTLLGITIGIASFVALLSMGDSLRAEVTEQADALGANLIVTPNTWCPVEQLSILTGEQLPESLPRDLVDEIAAIDGITAAVPYLTLGTAIQQTPVTLVGILPDEMKAHRGWQLEEGVFFADDTERAVVIGKGLAERFDLGAGDTVTLRGDTFSVLGVLGENGSNDDASVFMPLSVTQEVYGLRDYVSFIAVTVDDVRQTDRYIAAILDLANLAVSTDEELLGSVLLILGSVNTTLQLVAGVALIAAAFGIINTMMTATYERRREIGILRAIGVKRHSIFRMFMLESGLYGLLGGAVGLGVGFLVSRFAAPLIAQGGGGVTTFLGGTDHATTLSIPHMFAVLALSIAIAIVSGLCPAWKASKLTPMEAISHV